MAAGPADSPPAVAVEPGLEEARRLVREGNVVPVRLRLVDDCETPVSAFLKLRAAAAGAPCFLLESAEQGQVGRYSFLGFRQRDRGARSLPGRVGAPLALPPRRRRRPAALRGRRGRLLRLRPGAHGGAARRAEPGPAGAPGHGAAG